MEFRLSEVERLVRRSTAELVRDAIVPIAREIDQTGVVPAPILRSLGELGYFGACVPAELGGAEMGATALVLAVEEVARGCASTALLLVASNCLVVEALLDAGTPDQQTAWLPRLASGVSLGAGCLASSDEDSDPAAGESLGGRIAAGRRPAVTRRAAPAAALADLLLVRTGVDRRDAAQGIAVVVLERTSPSVQVGPPLSLFGQRACGAAVVTCDFSDLPESARLATGPRAVTLIDRLAAAFNLGLAAIAVGVAQAAFDCARCYSRERRQFGHPICDFGAIRSMVAQSGAEIEAARHLTLWAAAEWEAGRPFALLAGEARLVAGQTASRVADRAVQIHGGYGYTKDYAVERHYRDARILDLWEPAVEEVADGIAEGLLAVGSRGF